MKEVTDCLPENLNQLGYQRTNGVDSMKFAVSLITLLLSSAGLAASLDAADWSRFRGPNGSGVSTDTKPIPTEWSEEKNLKWKATLPGPGSSCPIVVGDRIFLTSWTGYADGNGEGSLEKLERHLICLDRETGKEVWRKSVPAKLPEDSFRGMFAENGYATHTPVSDGEIVVVFFGKSGVHAFDMDGEKLWEAGVGTERDQRGWGSASSPIIHKDIVIVTASVENHAVVGLDRKTGREVWKQEAEGFGSTWGTPVLVDVDDHTELVIGVPYEFWGLNPDDGKLLWYCEAINTNSMCSSVVAHEGIVYGIESGPGGGGVVAVKAGGKGDVSKTHVLWSGSDRSRVSSPLIHDGRLYFVNSGVVGCLDAKTGRRIYQGRLSGGSPAAEGGRDEGNGGGGRPGGFGGGRSRGGGYGGGQDYSSAVIADGKLFYARRSGDVFVVKLGDEFEQLAINRFESSAGDFNAAPAVSDGQLFIRSSKTLYCVTTTD